MNKQTMNKQIIEKIEELIEVIKTSENENSKLACCAQVRNEAGKTMENYKAFIDCLSKPIQNFNSEWTVIVNLGEIRRILYKIVVDIVMKKSEIEHKEIVESSEYSDSFLQDLIISGYFKMSDLHLLNTDQFKDKALVDSVGYAYNQIVSEESKYTPREGNIPENIIENVEAAGNPEKTKARTDKQELKNFLKSVDIISKMEEPVCTRKNKTELMKSADEVFGDTKVEYRGGILGSIDIQKVQLDALEEFVKQQNDSQEKAKNLQDIKDARIALLSCRNKKEHLENLNDIFSK